MRRTSLLAVLLLLTWLVPSGADRVQAQDDESAGMWVMRNGRGSPLEVPLCKETAREMSERYRAVGSDSEFKGRFELIVKEDGSIASVKVLDVLPEKSNPAKRWAMFEAKCLKKAHFHVESVPGITFPYSFEWRSTSSTTSRTLDRSEIGDIQRSVKENNER